MLYQPFTNQLFHFLNEVKQKRPLSVKIYLEFSYVCILKICRKNNETNLGTKLLKGSWSKLYNIQLICPHINPQPLVKCSDTINNNIFFFYRNQ